MYQLRMECKNKSIWRNETEEDSDSKMVLMKMVEELTPMKSKLKMFDQVFALLIGVVVMLCVVILVLVMN